jgi:hypothetical protein
MMRAIVQWLRVAAPPRWSGLWLLPIIGFELAYAWSSWKWPGQPLGELLHRRDNLVLLAAFSLGLRRAVDFHPLFHEGYRRWLCVTPWTSRLPLPVGPIHLVLQDALWLGVILALWHDPQCSRLYLPLCFITAYLVVICGSCLATGVEGISCVLAFGLGEVVRQWYTPSTALLVAFWLYLAGWIGVRRSLARFPWTLSRVWEVRSLQAIAEEQKQRMLGWPLDQLRTPPSEQEIGLFQRVVASLLIGWWCYCLSTLITMLPMASKLLGMGLALATLGAVVGRTVGYWLDYRPPISFWGRLWTLRWIIPRYDHILIPPTLILLVAGAMPTVLAGWRLPMEVALSITISLVVFLAISMPPSFDRWRLTGYHRIVPGSTNKQEFEKI